MFSAKRGVLIFLNVVLLSGLALAHGAETSGLKSMELFYSLSNVSLNLIYLSAIISTILVLISIKFQKQLRRYKSFLFVGIVIPLLISSLFLAGSTIYLNVLSETKGPIHWHSDFEIWNCGKKVDLKSPTGISNRIGTPVFHEHGDDRIHVEGVVMDLRSMDLHTFFDVVGGEMDLNSYNLPTDDGIVNVKNGDLCGYGSGVLQVFVYKTKNGQFTQEKLYNFPDYVLSSESLVPPGDCIIVDFDVEKEATDHICETYKVAIQKGELIGG